jgi:hypothetical protein
MKINLLHVKMVCVLGRCTLLKLGQKVKIILEDKFEYKKQRPGRAILIRISFQLVLIRFVQKDQGGDYFYKKI